MVLVRCSLCAFEEARVGTVTITVEIHGDRASAANSLNLDLEADLTIDDGKPLTFERERGKTSVLIWPNKSNCRMRTPQS